mgnify:CR=1 FL=1
MSDATANETKAPRKAGLATVVRALAPWVLVVLGGLWMLAGRSGGRDAMPAGEPVPALDLVLSDGSAFSLEEERGKPVLLTFWASWCPACRAEAPAIQAAHETLQRSGSRAVGLAVDARSIPAARGLGMEFAQGLVSQDDLARFGVELLPTTILVDAEGRVAASFVGEVRPEQLDEVIAPLLAAR